MCLIGILVKNLDKKLYFCSGRLCAYVPTACEDLDY